MKKILSVISALLLPALMLCGQNLRVSYAFLYKDNPSDKNFRTCMDMKLDYDGRESVFYSEGCFMRDSVSVYAFDDMGAIKNDEAYANLTRLPNGSHTDVYHIDYIKSAYDIYYRLIGHVYLGEGGPLEIPQWDLSSTEVKHFGGFEVKKATAKYLDREWTVWYTEEVSVPAGPWLLWGCPGLIVYAIDSESIFNFYILGQEYIGESRWKALRNNYTRGGHRILQYLSIKEEESIKCKLHRDMDFMNSVMGLIAGHTKDANGNILEEPKYRDFVPLIPDEYWKKK